MMLLLYQVAIRESLAMVKYIAINRNAYNGKEGPCRLKCQRSIKNYCGGSEMEQVKRFIRDEQGLETVEYAVILGLIVVATIGVVTALSTAVQSKFTTVTNTLK